ncbi:MAG TPA: hypothetical protein VGK30_12560 [Candidatus Binatia bacterium]
MRAPFVVALIVTCLLPTVAAAGVNDPPPAALPNRVFTVPGAIKTDKLDTVIACTDVDSASVSLKAQFYDQDGTLMGSSGGPNFSINPGGSIHFATGNLAGIPLSVSFNVGQFYGSARVVATSKKLICTGYVVDNASNPPAVMRTLPMIRGLAQKGD